MNILQTIGNTPLVELHYFSPRGRKIFAKLEGNNPGGSVKDRIALAMIEAAERDGTLKSGGIIIEPTSGNTGIGLAMVASAKGYHCVLAMPESMSEERRKLLRFLGAEIILTPAEKGMSGAIEKAQILMSENPNAFMPDQFSNPANPLVHREMTAPEIESELNRVPTAFVAGVGTSGTIIGVAQYFKIDMQANIEIIAVEPSESAVLSGSPKGSHGIQGIGAGFIPPIFDTELIDGIEKVSTEEAIDATRKLAVREAISAGISSGANVAAAVRVANRLPEGAIIVTVLPDRADRYLSIL